MLHYIHLHTRLHQFTKISVKSHSQWSSLDKYKHTPTSFSSLKAQTSGASFPIIMLISSGSEDIKQMCSMNQFKGCSW